MLSENQFRCVIAYDRLGFGQSDARDSDCEAVVIESAQAFVEDRTVKGIVDTHYFF